VTKLGSSSSGLTAAGYAVEARYSRAGPEPKNEFMHELNGEIAFIAAVCLASEE
jgi:hypothetical protein